MKTGFPTILVAAALSLALVSCSGQQHGTPSLPASSSATAEPTTSPTELEEPSPTESSEILVPEPTLWVGMNKTVYTLKDNAGTEKIGSGVTAKAQEGSGLVISIPRTSELTATYGKYDNSVVIHKDSEPVLFVEPPQSDDSSALWKWEIFETEDAFVLNALDSLNPETQVPASLHAILGQTVVEQVTWTDPPEGPRLMLTPGAWARTGSISVQTYGWGTVARDVPRVNDYPGLSLEHQFQCHTIGALDKDTWNLETWRPDVGLIGFMAEKCNPQ